MDKEKKQTEETLRAVYDRIAAKEEKLRTEIENRLLERITLMLDIETDDEIDGYFEGNF